MRSRSDVGKILRRLKRAYPVAECALEHENALQLLVATILSAQCTDARVNLVTRDLFREFNTAEDYAGVEPNELERRIRSTGFFRNKAKSIRGMAAKLLTEYDGEVPDRMEDLTELPGVARKTANVVLGTWFGKATGVVVDTHVSRISLRLGLTEEKNPIRIERDLMQQLPRGEWIGFSHRLIAHGRQTCKARNPRCEGCPLRDVCPYPDS